MSVLDRISIVLCRPEGSLNIGAVCRAMKNFGLSRLIITGKDLMIDRSQVEAMAIHAIDIFEQTRYFETLREPLQEHSLSAGMTRRRGSRRKSYSFLPEELADKIMMTQKGQIALVFGNEKHGLSDEELKLCDMAVHIPSDPAFPSLNLSHAVQIIGYCLYRRKEHRVGACTPIDREKMDSLIGDIVETLEATGYFIKANRKDTTIFLRDILSRTLLGKKESERIGKLFRQLRYYNRHEQTS
jgi:TrmH family RNA methyltransferase